MKYRDIGGRKVSAIGLGAMPMSIEGRPDEGQAIATIPVAFSPHLISMPSYLLTETLFAFTLLISMLLFVQATKKSNSLLFVCAGLGFGQFVNTQKRVLPQSNHVLLG